MQQASFSSPSESSPPTEDKKFPDIFIQMQLLKERKMCFKSSSIDILIISYAIEQNNSSSLTNASKCKNIHKFQEIKAVHNTELIYIYLIFTIQMLARYLILHRTLQFYILEHL